jgi:hypothetical protein
LLSIRHHVILGMTLLLASAIVPGAERYARAVDPFEIQVYDGSSDAPGVAGLELHVNDVASGRTRATPPERPPNHQAHLTLEPSLGLTRFWEIGGYLQTALLPDGQFDIAGFKLRSKLVTPPRWRPRWRLGCNLELSWVRAAYEAGQWGAEIRPIVAWEDSRWLFAANPIVEVSLAGAAPALAPALMALFKVGPVVELGVEYYGDIGPVTSPLPGRDQEHYLFEVVNILTSHLDINAGLGEGLTAGSNALVAKVILGYHAADPPAASRSPQGRL